MLAFGKYNIGRLAAFAVATMLTIGLAGCAGRDSQVAAPPPPGSGGPPPGGGPPGNGSVADIGDADYIVPTITSASIASPAVVNFALLDREGTRYRGATLAGNGMRFLLGQLAEPASAGSSSTWMLMAYESSNGGSGGAANWGSLVDHGDGTYTYTFATDATADGRYWPAQSTRVALQLGTPQAGNGIYTWQPSSGAVTGIYSREIVDTATCNSCHDDLEGHANRRETQYCVLCHTPDLADGAAYFPTLIHQLHAGKGPWGAGVEFPQAVSNCQTCHDDSDPNTPQAVNWKLVPTRVACGSCHDNVNFVTGEGHEAGPASDDQCVECHGPTSTLYNGSLRVAEVHANRQLMFSSQFGLEIVAVDGVLGDGSPGAAAGKVAPGEYAKVTIRVRNPSTGTAYNILDGAASSPFVGKSGASSPRLQVKVNWSNQDYSNYQSGVLDNSGYPRPGYATTIDFLAGGVTDNGNGTFTKTAPVPVPAAGISGSGTAFLVARAAMQVGADRVSGAAINSYVYIDAAGSAFPITDATAVPRRSVVDFDNCADCHKKAGLAAHGGTYAANNDSGFVCLSCHGPDRSCPQAGAPAPGVLDMKYMIHGIHAGTYDSCGHDFTGVTYPGKLANCEGCHRTDTFYPVDQAEVLASTVLNGADLADPTLDANISPNKAVCVSCHNSSFDLQHMYLNGASNNETATPDGGAVAPLVQQVDGTLISGNVEQCADCHGKGKDYDLRVMHGIDRFQYNR